MGLARTATHREVPAVGMRGGLGRTLLTVLLVLAILPLSIVSWYSSTRNRLNIQAEITEKLASIAALKEAQISRWVDEQQAILVALSTDAALANAAQSLATDNEAATRYLMMATEAYNLAAIGLLTREGIVGASNAPEMVGRTLPVSEGAPAAAHITFFPPDAPEGAGVVFTYALAEPLDGDLRYLAAWCSSAGMTDILHERVGLGQTGESYLVTGDGRILPRRQAAGQAALALHIDEPNQTLYENYAGVPVIGTQLAMPALDAVLVVEQAQEEAFAGNDDVTAAVITATLIAALAAAIVAAFVTRQVTRPIVRLTESTLSLASGNLSERVEIASRDEIGILAYVFNRMAADLETLYNDLEEKVAQRTRLLQQANYQIQRRAIQMLASVEVGQAITSILDSGRLLDEVVRLVRDRFVYSYAAIYTLNEETQCLDLRASAGVASPHHGAHVRLDAQNPVGRAFRETDPVLEDHEQAVPVGPPAVTTRFEVALPLRMGYRTTGVLDVQSTEPEGFDKDDVSILQNVAYQVTVALENARAYAVERKAAQQLREMDQFKRQFLVNMSHEFRTPLTNILGFSRLILKGLEGPLTDQQQQDVEIIYHNGEHLLGLINDLLDISQIDAGLMELQFKDVHLADLIHSVMSTASALVREKDVILKADIPPALPTIQADATRIRQVLLRLLTNAAKFTDHGEIAVTVWPEDERVLVSVRDTGIGIRPEDMGRIFKQFEQGTRVDGRRSEGAGLGLALSKEFVELHGGQMWVESEVGHGSTFTISLPLQPPPDART
ncbi:MAG: HAMP domain-containing protein [Anaerolineae bacterium]|nr:HAMP domain-containing protein [Anaerolineae bacterium]